MSATAPSLQQRRTRLLQLYQSALEAVSGEAAVVRYLQHHPFDETCSLVAIGKAAEAMAMGAQLVLGEQLRAGLVITKHGHGEPRLDAGRMVQLQSDHPIPGEGSLVAGNALLEFLANLPADEPLLFLLSGGASALAEVLPDTMSAEQLSELNRWLLASGLSIEQMNVIRKRLSRIKGGKLIPYLRGRSCLQLLISDVPGDKLSVIGSGPLMVESDIDSITTPLPGWLQPLVGTLPEPAGGEPADVDSQIIASNDMAREALVKAAQNVGAAVYDHPCHFQGDAEELAAEFSDAVLNGPAGLYLWGGESTVVLPQNPGRGGRNQHLALAAARYLSGHENVLLLAAGTDGSDGPTEDSGALVDGGTVQRGEWEGLSALAALQSADSGTFLQASGDLLHTGPTGTNVMDLVVAWKW